MSGTVGSSADVASIVEDRFSLYLERIRELCRMPSVSATGEGVRDVADVVLGLIQDAGGSARLIETGGHPLVLGSLDGPPGAPRLVRYGMYDVQPAEEPDWSAPPFAAEIVERPGVGPVVLGRGTANSKGSLAAFFCALDALRATDGGVPVGVAFFVEGEEELGSPRLEEAVRAHVDELSGDAGVDFDLFGAPSGGADLILGCKGLLSLEVSCSSGEWGGPARPLHSSEAAWIASPVWALVHALTDLVGPDEALRVPALLEGARTPGDADRALLVELADGFDPDEHLAEAGAMRYKLPGGTAELLEALIFRPTVNVNGLEAGYTGPGGKTILPNRARALLDIRLVPDLDATEVADAVREHLRSTGHPNVDVAALDHYPWAKSDPGSAVAAAMRTSYQRLDRRVLPYPMAPWCAPFHVFDRVLDIPWASGGLGFSGGAHGPDEFASVEGLHEHILGVAEFLRAFAATAA